MAKQQRSLASTPPGAKSWEQVRKLETVGDCKRFLVYLIDQVRRKKISIKEGYFLNQVVGTYVNLIVDHELEARIAELERLKTAGRLSTPTSITIRAGGSA